MVAAPASDTEVSHNPSASPERTFHRPVLATVLAVLLPLALAAGGAFSWWHIDAVDAVERRQSDEVAVTQAAERFVETWNTFTPQDVDTYVERVSGLLSTKFRTEFTDAAEDVVRGVEAQQLSSTGEVLVDEAGIPLVGIASLDESTAHVLVVSDAQRVAGGQEVLRHWRWQVSLVKVDGQWLVDAFSEA